MAYNEKYINFKKIKSLIKYEYFGPKLMSAELSLDKYENFSLQIFIKWIVETKIKLIKYERESKHQLVWGMFYAK